MSRGVSTGGGLDDLPLHIRKGHGRDRDWHRIAKCRGVDPDRNVWLADPRAKRVRIAGVYRTGAEVEAAALIVCAGCPAQYDCALWALDVPEAFCTWAVARDEMDRMQHRKGEARQVIEAARNSGTSVQAAWAARSSR